MSKPANKRKHIPAGKVRSYWQEHISEAIALGFNGRVIENIEDDYDELRLCWCCGSQGYQESAHIIPHSLGGQSTPSNFFLLCHECHVRSPDFAIAKPFIDYINEYAVSCTDLIVEVVTYGKRKLEALSFEDEKKMYALAEVFESRLMEACTEAFKMAGYHAASQSRSTKMAAFRYAIDKVIDEFDPSSSAEDIECQLEEDDKSAAISRAPSNSLPAR
ncbi:HNH endonuclease [Halomonas aquamarina]|uniref:HNH endonuclease n=1 Tax=Vreelandella aquamarina TaxID=77097 RepID=A0ACC5VT49_9GAMM|nr:HNH endonuclease [Halomonas aquamarina]MBZ5486904.1 HNH endonuclease [Halomonas aquamarina]